MKLFYVRAYAVTAFVALVAVLTLSSCLKKPSPRVSDISFKTISIDTIVPLFEGRDRPACHLQYNVDCPDQGNADLVGKVNAFILAQLNLDQRGNDIRTALMSLLADQVEAYKSEGGDAAGNYGNQNDAPSSWLSFEDIVEGHVVYSTDGLISYHVRCYNYQGGAHGNINQINGVFDCAAGFRIRLEDVYHEDAAESVNKLIHAVILKQYDCSTDDELTNVGFFEPANIAASENFYIDELGITWQYDPYELAAYMLGPVSVCIPWDSILPYIAPESPLRGMAMKYSANPVAEIS